ncbi:aspartate carbamoyltransferase [Candidatus Gottesmanbacteria bacterium]|nr:aspartate carbamoyltransferase [Candidatus Gottesmanbacteria bacterium]
MKNTLFQQDILTADQFDRSLLDMVLNTARKMRTVVLKKGCTDILKGKIVTALFYEPSSRTFSSFITAAQRLGAGFIPLQGVTYSSVSKGETLPDTIRTFASYSDAIVLRHSEVGAARIAADFSPKPVINAGDGVGEHPTQALLDMFTIVDTFGSADNLTVTMVGDLLNGRTIHSLSRLLALYKNVQVDLVSPSLLKLPEGLKNTLQKRGLVIHEYEKLDDALKSTDVLYVTRVQKERFTDLDMYEQLKHKYIITSDTLHNMKKSAVVLHPFPRVGEIEFEVDLDPRALYINGQMVNGMYVRMAILALVLKKTV